MQTIFRNPQKSQVQDWCGSAFWALSFTLTPHLQVKNTPMVWAHPLTLPILHTHAHPLQLPEQDKPMSPLHVFLMCNQNTHYSTSVVVSSNPLIMNAIITMLGTVAITNLKREHCQLCPCNKTEDIRMLLREK